MSAPTPTSRTPGALLKRGGRLLLNRMGAWKARSYHFYCPLCEWRVKRFKPLDRVYIESKAKYGWPYRFEDIETINVDQYGCPRCGGSDRDRLYALYVRSRLASLGSGETFSLVDFGPSRPWEKCARTLHGIRYRTADLLRTDVDDTVDITDMKLYADGSLDAFICGHILEHVPDDRKALTELLRVLKPRGWAILMVPINLAAKAIDEDPGVTDPAERWRRFGQHDHIRLYTKNGFIERVEAAGFAIHQCGIDYFGAEIFERCGITPQSVLYVVDKGTNAGVAVPMVTPDALKSSRG